MNQQRGIITDQQGYLTACVFALSCALLLDLLGQPGDLPVLGPLPVLPTTLAASIAGLAASVVLCRRGVPLAIRSGITRRGVLGLLALGALLALPPIAIDLTLRFPKDLNFPLPGALFFYPAIALVAETVFHLIPLALLALFLPRDLPAHWLIIPVILIEPLFQMAFLSEAPLRSLLVLGNVALISAAQLWLYLRHGFAAMIGLRLCFYLFWHILWGAARLELLF